MFERSEFRRTRGALSDQASVGREHGAKKKAACRLCTESADKQNTERSRAVRPDLATKRSGKESGQGQNYQRSRQTNRRYYSVPKKNAVNSPKVAKRKSGAFAVPNP
jgi:hypothetical protein